MIREPTDEDLIAFAATLLGGRNKALADPEILRETVTEARELWITLYQAHYRGDPSHP
ncbi:MAG: hypothetical protein ACTHKS_06080 [Gaiellaceae bacterium]